MTLSNYEDMVCFTTGPVSKRSNQQFESSVVLSQMLRITPQAIGSSDNFRSTSKINFSWQWRCSRKLFAFKSIIVVSKVKRQITNSIRSNVAEYWVDHKNWKHHKAIKRKSSQHPRFISTFYESRTNAKKLLKWRWFSGCNELNLFEKINLDI